MARRSQIEDGEAVAVFLDRLSDVETFNVTCTAFLWEELGGSSTVDVNRAGGKIVGSILHLKSGTAV